MNIGLIGKKTGMTQIFNEDGTVVAAVVIEAGPCYVVDIKTNARDGYSAIKIGFGETKEKKLRKPQLLDFKKRELPLLKKLREIRLNGDEETAGYKVGQKINVADIFKENDYVDVTARSIGKGFQGVMKRHGFRGGPATHGSMSHRAPGSIGSTDAARVFKGKRMPGHMGNRNVNMQNIRVLKVLGEENLLLLKGSVPGPVNNYIIVKKSIKKQST